MSRLGCQAPTGHRWSVHSRARRGPRPVGLGESEGLKEVEVLVVGAPEGVVAVAKALQGVEMAALVGKKGVEAPPPRRN